MGFGILEGYYVAEGFRGLGFASDVWGGLGVMG